MDHCSRQCSQVAEGGKFRKANWYVCLVSLSWTLSLPTPFH